MSYTSGMAFIRKVKTGSGAIAVQVAYKSAGKITKIIHIGSAHTTEHLESLMVIANQKLLGSQQPLFSEPNTEFQVKIKNSHSALLLELLRKQYEKIGFQKLEDNDFEYLCLGRIVEPVSKLDTIRVLNDLGVHHLNKDRLYRCLSRTSQNNYRNKISSLCFKYANKNDITLVLYDVTTLYFEIQKEDTYRKPGMSKERRLEPQIIVGLLVDQHGFPLAIHSFEGNKAETTTILPVIEDFKKQHGLSNITVVADAGMLSAKNLTALINAGYHYIVGSRLNKIPYDITEFKKNHELTDKQIICTKINDIQRIIYQYREKRATLDKHNIKKQIEKAIKIATGKITGKKNKFLTVKTKEKKLNQTLIDKAYQLAGIKGYVTDLDLPDQEIISHYQQLWNVEASFRMSKSDLRARPIFHRKRESIESHLTIVLAALAISKIIEKSTGLSIKLFVKTLRPIRSGSILINGKEYPAEPAIPEEIKNLIEKLKMGH